MTLARFDTSRAVGVLIDWVADRDGIDPTEWLVGVALLAYPIAPDLGLRLWHRLGLDGSPSTEGLSSPVGITVQGGARDAVTPLSLEALAPFVHQGVSA
jgi:hypothetical protein